MASLKRLKEANIRFKYSVFGYLREYEEKTQQLNSNIPKMVKYICLSYYLLDEKFTKHGDKMNLNDDKNIVTKCNPFCDTVYGNIKIDSNDESILEYLWRFKLLNLTERTDFYLGIDSSNFTKANTQLISGLPTFYAPVFACDCFFITHTNEKNKAGKSCYYAPKVGDEIDMVCNVKDETLKLKVNGKELSAYIKDIRFKDKIYRMVLSMKQNTQSIQLLQFGVKYC